MRKLCTFLLFSTLPLFAQSPVSVVGATFTNTSQKAIVLIAGDLSFVVGTGQPMVLPFVHDAIFKQTANLTNPGASESFSDGRPTPPTLTITFVQYADGTTWGDPNSQSAQAALARRKAALSYVQTLASTGTDSDFLAALNKAQTDKNVIKEQKRYQADVQNGGASTARANVQARWSAAQSRSSLWNF